MDTRKQADDCFVMRPSSVSQQGAQCKNCCTVGVKMVGIIRAGVMGRPGLGYGQGRVQRTDFCDGDFAGQVPEGGAKSYVQPGVGSVGTDRAAW